MISGKVPENIESVGRAGAKRVNFYPKGEARSQVVVQHSKLPHARAAAKMKKFWGEALDRLRASLEK